ncbi:MAG: biotin-dependent carboxyltransferase family protein [Chloroflexi bacterium]|nr:biotin-dependent carboxyltransferase family protein [Chloroflexota bacterium]
MIEVVEPGALTSVQTPGGRPGWRHLGIGVGGAADPWSARLANRLVGNRDDDALLEVTVTGPTLRFGAPSAVAVTGSRFGASLDGVPIPRGAGRPVRAGSVLRMGRGSGARAYVAVAGGIEVPTVLGSRATNLRSGFGGHAGRALRAGDRLEIGRPGGSLYRWAAEWPGGAVRVVPALDGAGLSELLEDEWTVSGQADRTGVRLDGPRIRLQPPEVVSMGLPLGAIQIPPDGRPIVMLGERPVTGGYPVPACVIRADIGHMAQLRPGGRVRFTEVTREVALESWAEIERRLEALEEVASPDPTDEGRWAGALE